MKTKFRTTGHDVLKPAPAPKPEDAPGVIQPGRLAVLDHKGRHRATVGPRATSATVARLIGQHGAKLGTGPDGKKAWISPPSRNVTGGRGSPQAAKHAKQIKQSRGSVRTWG